MTDETHNQLGSINVYKPSGKGTLLSDLIKDKEDTPQIKKQQSKPQTRLQERKQERQQEREQAREQEREQSENIEDSYDDIVDNSKFRRQLIRRPKLHKIKKQYIEKPKPQKIIDYVLFVFEIIIILSLYVIMSQPFVISFLAKYINQLNPNENGEASMAGIVIYGFILAVLFLIIRKIVFSRL